jgi:hypothetical protein
MLNQEYRIGKGQNIYLYRTIYKLNQGFFVISEVKY